MPSILLALTLSLACVAAQQTILSNDTHLTYSDGDWQEANVCLYNKDGKLVGAQPSCWNFGPQPCADLSQYTITPNASVSLKFNGTGIALHTVSQSAGLASEVTVTLDGQNATTYKTEPDHRPFTCPEPPFSRSGLSGDVEHTVTVTVRAAAGAKADDLASGPEFANAPFLGIQSFIVTSAADDDAKSSADTNSTVLPANSPDSAAGALQPGTSCVAIAAVIVGALFA